MQSASLCHQANNALQVAPAIDPNTAYLADKLERATKKFVYIMRALLQSLDGRCSRQGRYRDHARGILVGLINWMVVFAGRSSKLIDSVQVSSHMSEGISLRL